MTKVSMYQRNGDEAHYNEKYITKLINNYRSHPHILEVIYANYTAYLIPRYSHRKYGYRMPISLSDDRHNFGVKRCLDAIKDPDLSHKSKSFICRFNVDFTSS